MQVMTTYIAEPGPRSRRTAGLIKVGASHSPQRRARGLGMRLIVATTLPEHLVHKLFAPFVVPLEEVRARKLVPDRRQEWYFDCAEIRELADWIGRVHSARQAVLHDDVALYMCENPDRGGDPDDFRRVIRAKELLGS
jgi:hypothetical protein